MELNKVPESFHDRVDQIGRDAKAKIAAGVPESFHDGVDAAARELKAQIVAKVGDTESYHDWVDEIGRGAKQKLVTGWQKAYKWTSMQLWALATLMATAEPFLQLINANPTFLAVTQSLWWQLGTAAIGLAGMYARVVKQKPVTEEAALEAAAVQAVRSAG